MPQSPVPASFDSQQHWSDHQFASCLEKLTSGPWQFIQLRGESIGAVLESGDDVDLLGSRESVDQLLHVVLNWVQEQKCHVRIRGQNADKVELTLFSIDARQSVTFDFWIQLWQLDRRRDVLTFARCQSAVIDSKQTIQRLPVPLEVCVYIQHLICKKKDLSSQRVKCRLTNYAKQCSSAGAVVISQLAERIISTECVDEACEQQTLQYIRQHVVESNQNSRRRALARKLHVKLIGPPRKIDMLTMMGCDGAGKTSLAHAIKDSQGKIHRVYTGKHLYRKSLTYKLAVIFIRPVLFQDRERFDEILAPLAYLRASLGLRLLRLSRRSGITLIDRSLVDFLYLDRKSNAPRFSRFQWLMNWFGLRLPNVHCIASHENVMQRKQEVTEQGHEQYDRDIFKTFTQRCPTDYIAFNNDQTLKESQQALTRILVHMNVIQAEDAAAQVTSNQKRAA